MKYFPRVTLLMWVAILLFWVSMGVAAQPGGTMQVKTPAPYLRLAVFSQRPFQADVHTSTTGQAGSYYEREHVRVSGQKIRQEKLGEPSIFGLDTSIRNFEDEEHFGTRGLNDTLKLYVDINDHLSSAYEAQSRENIRSVMRRYRWDDADWERLGPERVQGKDALHYRYVGGVGKEQGPDTQVWFSSATGVPLKISVTTDAGQATSRFENIEIGPQPAEAFEVGEAFAKVSVQDYGRWLMLQGGNSPALAEGKTGQGQALAEEIRQLTSRFRGDS